MSTPLLTTKLYIPPYRDSLVSRPRLVQKINSGIDQKLTLISAPAGFGKTTLLTEWIRRSNKQVTWLSLDEDDNNLKRFLTYLITALGKIDDCIGDGILPLLKATGDPPIEPLLTRLINNLSLIDGEFYLVLDDYHLISKPEIHEIVNFLLEHLPPNAHFLISGRVDPPIAISRMRARDQMIEIRPNDLRFIESEGKIYLNDLSGLDLSPEDIYALVSRTEGWITGLQLAALSMRGRKNIHEFVADFSGSHQYIIDYLVDEVMARQPQELRTFLYRTSLLSRFCASLCDAVLEITESRRIIHEIDEANLFLVHLDDERNWYRYHHLFSDFLNQRLIEIEPEISLKLHSRASIWFEDNGFLTDAINHALVGNEFTRAAKLIERVGPEMMMHSEFDQLTSWLDALPQDQVNSWPWLCIIRAWMCQRWAQFDQGEYYLHCAEQALEAETTPEPMDGVEVIKGQICAIRALFTLSRGQIAQAIKYANQALEFLPEDYFNRPVAADALGIAMKFSGDFNGAIKVLIEARRDSLAVGNHILAQAIILELGITYLLQGRLQSAAEAFREAIAYTYQDTQIKIPYASGASVYLASILYEWDQLDEAMTHIDEGIGIGIPAKMVDAVAIGYGIKARVYLAQGDLEGALTACQNAERMINDIPDIEDDTISITLDSHIKLLLANNNFAEAVRLLQEQGIKPEDNIEYFLQHKHITLSRVLVYMGRETPEEKHLSQAQNLLDGLLTVIQPVGCIGKTIEIIVLQAMAYEAQGMHVKALDSLGEALSLAEPEGYVRTFTDEGEPMRELLHAAYSREISKSYVGQLLNAFESQPINQTYISQPLIEPLTKRELQVLRLLPTELTGPEIAQELSVSLNTLRTHTKNIYGKLNVTNRRAAVLRADQLDLL